MSSALWSTFLSFFLTLRYNTRATKWVNGGKNEFSVQKFYVTVDGYNTDPVQEGYQPSKPYFPVADKCDKSKDPAEKCVYPDDVFYMTSSPMYAADTVTVSIYDEQMKEIASSTVQKQTYKTYTPSDLGCSDDRSECPSKCRNKNGVWYNQYQTCYVYYSISDFCFRVRKNNDAWVSDLPPKESLSYTGDGCYYSTRYSPAAYSRSQTIPASIPVVIRSYLDPVISASETTRGCSDSYISGSANHYCFGMSRAEQTATGVTLFIIGLIIYAAEAAVS